MAPGRPPLPSSTVALVHEVIVKSPLGRLLGLVPEEVREDDATVRLPFRADVTTVGDLVHGGALAALVDVAATAAAWSTSTPPAEARGTTVGLTVNYLAPARGRDVVAHATVVRRGRSLVVCDVEITAGDEPCVKALVTYKLG